MNNSFGRLLSILLVLLAVPLIAFFTSLYLLQKYESDWNEGLVKELEQHPELSSVRAEKLEEFSIRTICSNPEKARTLKIDCSDYDALGLMRHASVWAGSIGLSLMVLIFFAGRIARTNRTLLLVLFKPGMYVTLITVVMMVAVHAALAMASIYYGESAAIGRVHVGIVFMIGVGAALGVFGMIRASLSIIQRARMMVVGKTLDNKSAPLLWTFVNSVAQKVGANPPQFLVAGLNPTFFVTEAEIRCLDGNLAGRTMYLSLPLCRILAKQEVEAIIGHELGHFKGLDTKFSQKFYPIYRGTYNSLIAIRENMGDGARSIALLPAMAVLSFFLESFAVAESQISRERELAADKVAAQAAGARNIGSSLLKLYAFSEYWGAILAAMKKALADEKQYTNVSSLFSEVVQQNSNKAVLEGLDSKHLTHPTDSHPPLTQRLQALGLSIPDLTEEALQTSPSSPAIDLIDNYEILEKELNDAEHYLLSKA